ncbi:MAG: ATP-binding protein [Solirubrobacteraceae bacterium]
MVARRTLRLRLTLLYGGLFLIAGAVLLAITYGLVAHTSTPTLDGRFYVSRKLNPRALTPPVQVTGTDSRALPGSPVPWAGAIIELQEAYGRDVTQALLTVTNADQARLDALQKRANVSLQRQHTAQLDALLTISGIALGIMAFVSIGLGWLVAGRALEPIRTISARARGISERNLHERLAPTPCPDGELGELAGTFDGLLERLEAAFESQRRFVANASHELRTPITLQRALLEVALADPDASAQTLRGACARVLATGEQQERMIEALLTLARSQRGLEARSLLDLGEIVAEGVDGLRADGVRVDASLSGAPIAGDRALIERLVANLIDNAVRHNQPGGWMMAWTGVEDGRSMLRVSNSGPVIAADEVGALVEPFRRRNGDRAASRRGHGLGLSIVDAIATAHGARLRAVPRDGGGLELEVAFPPP